MPDACGLGHRDPQGDHRRGRCDREPKDALTHYCHFDVSPPPAVGALMVMDDKRCCGKVAHFAIDVENGVWLCAEHYDVWTAYSSGHSDYPSLFDQTP